MTLLLVSKAGLSKLTNLARATASTLRTGSKPPKADHTKRRLSSVLLARLRKDASRFRRPPLAAKVCGGLNNARSCREFYLQVSTALPSLSLFPTVPLNHRWNYDHFACETKSEDDFMLFDIGHHGKFGSAVESKYFLVYFIGNLTSRNVLVEQAQVEALLLLLSL